VAFDVCDIPEIWPSNPQYTLIIFPVSTKSNKPNKRHQAPSYIKEFRVSPAKSRKPYINPLRQTRHTGECISQPK
jgi:hypothetical protein